MVSVDLGAIALCRLRASGRCVQRVISTSEQQWTRHSSLQMESVEVAEVMTLPRRASDDYFPALDSFRLVE